MPSLSECVLTCLEEDDHHILTDPLDLFARFDLDIDAISSVDGSWEPVDIVDRTQPHVDELLDDVFTTEGPSVFLRDNYMIVRGREDVHHVFFVFERTV